jgi:hypothetical protein
MSRYRIDGSITAPGIAFSAHLVVFCLLAAYFYSLMQPQYIPNPGLAAYKPPPATIINYETGIGYEMPAQSPAQAQQEQTALLLGEMGSRPEKPKPSVAESQRERKIAVKKAKRPSARTASSARGNPLGHYAIPYYSRARGNPYYATPHYWYWGHRAF